MIDTEFSEKCADVNNSGNYDPFRPDEGAIMADPEATYIYEDGKLYWEDLR